MLSHLLISVCSLAVASCTSCRWDKGDGQIPKWTLLHLSRREESSKKFVTIFRSLNERESLDLVMCNSWKRTTFHNMIYGGQILKLDQRWLLEFGPDVIMFLCCGGFQDNSVNCTTKFWATVSVDSTVSKHQQRKDCCLSGFSLNDLSLSSLRVSTEEKNGKPNVLFLVPSTTVAEDKMKNDLFRCVTNWTEVMLDPRLCGRCSNMVMLLCDLCECHWQRFTSCSHHQSHMHSPWVEIMGNGIKLGALLV